MKKGGPKNKINKKIKLAIQKKIGGGAELVKITQPLRTKKIMQPLGKKITCNLSGQKNHATSLGKKITQPFGIKKNHATSWDKKIKQPLRTKQNHTTSWEKNPQPLGPR